MKPFTLPLVALLLAGCTSAPAATPTPPPSPSVFSVSGVMVLQEFSLRSKPGEKCQGYDGYADMREGAQVKVKDAAGKVVALGALRAGVGLESAATDRGIRACSFAFVVQGVPDSGDAIYGVEVADRGTIQFKKADADSLSLTLG